MAARPGPARDGVLVVGAGAAGLVTLKVLHEHGVAAEAVDRHGDVGGLFAARPDPSVHLTARARATAFPGLPFAGGGDARPSFAQAHAYLGAYAAQHDLRRWIRLRTAVARMEPHPGGGWWVTTAAGEVRRNRAVVLAVGRTPGRRRFAPGEPACPVVPAASFAGPEQVAGLRVLVLGSGRAARDVAVEAALSARQTLLDRRALVRLSASGDHGLPRPDPRIFGVRDGARLRRALASGEIAARPPVGAIVDGRAVFRCGGSEAVDLVVDATGGAVEIPFLDHWRLPWAGGKPDLLLGVAHPARTDLFATGLTGTGAPAWPIIERQAQLVARLVDAGPDATAAFRRHARSGGESGRYRRALERAARRLDRAGAPHPQAAPIQAT